MTNPLQGLSEVKAQHGLPPVEKWNPPFCGDINMEIKRDGTWFYENTPIGRKELVRLFSTILWREGDEYFLVTPVEKVGIRVEDVPFIAEDMNKDDDAIHFTTNTGDKMVAGPDCPIEIVYRGDGEPQPYILVRRNLWARIDRKNFYRLVDMGEVEGDKFGVRSNGVFFPIIDTEKLDL